MTRVIYLAVLLLLTGCSAPGEPKVQENNTSNVFDYYVPEGACEGASGIPEGSQECTSDDQCNADEACSATPAVYGPDTVGGEDAAPGVSCEDSFCDPNVQCESDSDCPLDGEICRRVTRQECCGPVYDNATCDPPCQAGECPVGERCSEDDGQCHAIPCEDPEHECSTLFVCDPAREGGDRHGCVLASCDLDGAECPADHVCDPERAARTNDCAPRRCEDGYDCGVNQDCDAETEGHGCRKRSCSDDTDCDCGACVNAQCEPRVFVCAPT